MTRLALVLSLLTLAALAQPGAEKNEPLPHWAIDYSKSGGIAGLAQHLYLADDAHAVVTNGYGDFAKKADLSATAEEMSAIVAVLRKIKLPETAREKPSGPPIPDAIGSSIVLTWDGKQFSITTSGPALGAAIHPIMTRGLKQVQR